MQNESPLLTIENPECRLVLAAYRVTMAALRLKFLTAKANFNPAQPRVPAGEPEGGQWTGRNGGGLSAGRARTRRTDKLPSHTPSGADVQKNMAEAADHKMDYLWFYNQVHNHGPWDYKQMGSQYADFGNFNFGATGRAAGFSEATLLRMAGWAQVRAGTSRADWGTPVNLAEALLGIGGEAPYGDDPNDQYWIEQGFSYYEAHKPKKF